MPTYTATQPDLAAILLVAAETAREAGALIREAYARDDRTIENKSSAIDWVTQYDKASEALIVGRLRAAFPDFGIIGEEGTDEMGSQPYTWYIDPIDGTTNFAHGFPMFCVSIALYHDETALVAVVYDPLRDECFSATRGGGAHLTVGKVTRPLHVSSETRLVAALLATGYPYDVHTSPANNLVETGLFALAAQGLRRAGSAALDLAYVAAGRLDGYWEYKLSSWDVAASWLIVQEAGGVVTDFDGRPVAIRRMVDLLVSNGHLHEQMVEVLKARRQ